MVEVKLTLANDDVSSIRRWLAGEKKVLADLMVAGQPTQQTSGATLAYSLVVRIDDQLVAHQTLLNKLEREEREKRRR